MKLEEDIEAGTAVTRQYLEFEDAIPGDELHLDKDFEVRLVPKIHHRWSLKTPYPEMSFIWIRILR